MERNTDVQIVRRRPDGGIEIEAPRVASAEPMPETIARGNAIQRERARRSGRQPSGVYAADYPVEGGWGYTREDACIIKRRTPRRSFGGLPDTSDAVRFEYIFVERRILEEIIVHRPPSTPDLHNLRWKPVQQRLKVGPGGRTYDNLAFDVSGFLLEDFEELKEDWETHGAYENDPEGRKRHLARAASKTIHYRTEYWFDITEA